MIGRLGALPIVLIIILSGNQQILAQDCLTCDNTTDLPLDCPFDGGERTYVVRGCRVNVIAEWKNWDAIEQKDFCLATPPQGTILRDHEEKVISNNNGSFQFLNILRDSTFHMKKM